MRNDHSPSRTRRLGLGGLLLVGAVTLGTPACSGSTDGGSATTLDAVVSATSAAPTQGTTGTVSPTTTSAPPPASTAPAATIPQPVMIDDLPVAPETQRIDLAMPTFSNPTDVTNPLHPSALVESVLLLGTVDDQAFRTEVTLLPVTRIIDWDGQRIEALVSQYVAFLDGRIQEVAYDFYAQADDGSVWYLGEDVFNFADGAIVDTHGTWIAGKDGPGAMIMPADPQIDDTYRPENIPGFVFEEVTVTDVDQQVEGPLGPIDGAIIISELHMDGGLEDKTFAPGYGEFYTSGGGDTEALALAVPTDAATGTTPAELDQLLSGAMTVLDAVNTGEWPTATVAVEEVATAWERYTRNPVPALIEPVMAGAVDDLMSSVDARDAAAAARAGMAVAQSAADLQLRYRPVVDVDLIRFDLWLAQFVIDAAAGDQAAVNGDSFTLDYLRDRIQASVTGSDATQLNAGLEELQTAVSDGDLPAAAEAASTLRGFVATL